MPLFYHKRDRITSFFAQKSQRTDICSAAADVHAEKSDEGGTVHAGKGAAHAEKISFGKAQGNAAPDVCLARGGNGGGAHARRTDAREAGKRLRARTEYCENVHDFSSCKAAQFRGYAAYITVYAALCEKVLRQRLAMKSQADKGKIIQEE